MSYQKLRSSSLIAIPLIGSLLGSLAAPAIAIPQNSYPYDCYRKTDGQYAGGGQRGGADQNHICVPNPNFRHSVAPQQRRPSQPNRSSRYRTPPRRYSRSRGGSFGSGVAVGVGGTLLFDALTRPRWGDWGYGDSVIIDDSVNIIGDRAEWNDWGDDIDADFGDGDDIDWGDDWGDDFGDDWGDDFGDDW